ncbi:type I glyceraldehyde-3-phosphate dehydrogenase [Flavobacterium aurantiibacter]|uniref:Type I glyceraldehyde-3-phosphate dehydrogenase n=1 Tax=Flavobacterium aurantiibacter TaxID=2023067 RepID=A0A255ZAY1_9FLAO|nr:type I glyceraldehyde-3-phosphate dehydrogenase [Flavobacterium aurantiibacter]OYQ38609.1 type I glyceraldehyde-3-phosphate dehydrogenase [Flavobacterium aurantiibacter]
MAKIRVGINGFGRIGRTVLRLLARETDIEVVAINDVADKSTMLHLLKYDSIHGILSDEIVSTEEGFKLNEHQISYSQHGNPADIAWDRHSVDYVIESSGKFKTVDELSQHLKTGVQKVVLAAPSETEAIKMVVLGVNEAVLDGSEKLISNASCTTNNAAPMLKIIDELCGIEQAYITTVHSYTTDQSLHDQPHKDLRRARAASQSIVPTTTGAAKALTRIFPNLSNKMGGGGIRVPVPDGSLTDITCYVSRETSVSEINAAFRFAAENRYQGILAYTEDPIVSVDILGNRNSCLFDAQLTSVIDRMVKIVGWYDNETGYSSRIIDLLRHIAKK